MKDFAKSIVCNTKTEVAKVENNIPDAQINGPSAAEIREVAGRIYKTDMREDDLARAVSFELAKKYKAFQTNTHIMDMVKEVLKKFKIGNSKVGNKKVGNSFESAKSEYEKAVREIESELKSAKPNINKYFQINERLGRILSSERNNIQKELSAKISELINMESNISRLEDKFYK